MRPNLLILCSIFLSSLLGLTHYSAAQTAGPVLVMQADNVIEVPSIASQIANGTFIPAENISGEVNPKRRGANKPVPGKGLPVDGDPLRKNQEGALQYKSREPILTFVAASANSTPTDPTGAVGPDHYVNAWNSSFRIWDKSGNPLTAPASLGTIFPGQTLGDPIVIYDQIEDRFLITEFFFNGFLVAICQGSDPVNDGWYTYQFNTNTFPDYPKFSLWSDGYYITANKDSGSAGSSEVVFVIERDKMLTGDESALMIGFPLPGIRTSGFYSPLGFNVNGPQLPPAGNAPVVYMQDDVWSGVSEDHLKIWNINVDWDDPDNSTISAAQELSTEPFDGLFDGGSFSNLPQPSGPDLDALQATIMYMAQYRRFETYNAVVFNFVVDLDGNDDYSGIRWYELRQNSDGEPWSIYQEGTYTQPEGHSAYCGNMCIDSDGNIAMAYSIVSETQYPSIRYTGRFATDDLNTMTLEEETIVDGTQSDPSYRYGDYAQMTVDPVDDKTFWSIAEYFSGNTRKNQVGVFKIAPDFSHDVGVISIDSPVDGTLSESDTIKVTIRNYGLMSQYDIPVSYQIDEGEVISEIFTDTIESNTNAQFTFSTTGDFSVVGASYTIKAFTDLAADENVENDTLTKIVTHLYPNDLGIVSVQSPQTGPELSDSEEITVQIENAGGEAQENFDVTFELDDNEPVTEQVPGPLMGTSTMSYTFITTGDFSQLGDHNLSVYTSLDDDADTSNDTVINVITHEFCQPEMDCTAGDGIARLELGSIINPSGCDENGYGDYTHLMTDLWPGAVDELIITSNYGNQYLKVWIDLNDNFLFENDEVVIDNYIIAEGEGAGTYTEWIPFPVPVTENLGEHLMRAKTNWNDSVPENACEATQYGETEDYTVNVDNTTGVNLPVSETGELVIRQSGDNKFHCNLQAPGSYQTLVITVHDINGRKLIENRVENVNGQYDYTFDMSYAPKGIYLVRLGSTTFGKVRKIWVR